MRKADRRKVMRIRNGSLPLDEILIYEDLVVAQRPRRAYAVQRKYSQAQLPIGAKVVHSIFDERADVGAKQSVQKIHIVGKLGERPSFALRGAANARLSVAVAGNNFNFIHGGIIVVAWNDDNALAPIRSKHIAVRP